VTHARQTIREGAAALLKVSPSTYSSVQESRVPSSRQIWPYLLVFADAEVSDLLTEDIPGILSRSMQLVIVGMLRMPGNGDTQTIEDKMDAMTAELETKLSFSTLQAAVGAVKGMTLTGTTMEVVLTPEEAISHAEVTQVWQVDYYTADGSPEALL